MPELNDDDLSEISRLAQRAQQIDRRGLLKVSGRALAFALPAIATFAIAPDALGATGSGGQLSVGPKMMASWLLDPR